MINYLTWPFRYVTEFADLVRQSVTLVAQCTVRDLCHAVWVKVSDLGQTNNPNTTPIKGLRKGEWWCASTEPEGKSLMGRGMLLHQRDDADTDRGHS